MVGLIRKSTGTAIEVTKNLSTTKQCHSTLSLCDKAFNMCESGIPLPLDMTQGIFGGALQDQRRSSFHRTECEAG
jgi:hypothetical protein